MGNVGGPGACGCGVSATPSVAVLRQKTSHGRILAYLLTATERMTIFTLGCSYQRTPNTRTDPKHRYRFLRPQTRDRELRAATLSGPSTFWCGRVPLESLVFDQATIDQLAAALAPRIAALLGSSAKTVYSTSKLGPYCPGKSKGWMVRNLKIMPGARKIGRDWTITGEDYDAWCRAQDTARCRKPQPPTGTEEDLADSYLQAAGLRKAS